MARLRSSFNIALRIAALAASVASMYCSLPLPYSFAICLRPLNSKAPNLSDGTSSDSRKLTMEVSSVIKASVDADDTENASRNRGTPVVGAETSENIWVYACLARWI
jgi:hypothetical protein